MADSVQPVDSILKGLTFKDAVMNLTSACYKLNVDLISKSCWNRILDFQGVEGNSNEENNIALSILKETCKPKEVDGSIEVMDWLNNLRSEIVIREFSVMELVIF